MTDNRRSVRRHLPLLVLALVLGPAFAQPPDVYREGPGIKAPKILHKVKPGYTRQAYYGRIQGKVVCEVIVDEHGKPTTITVVSPLGLGLDEQAQSAVRRWEFTPGMKDGQPVKVMIMVEVDFRFPGTWFDDKAEKRRSSFNVALTNLTRPNLAVDAVKKIEDLARQKYVPAMHVFGRLLFMGQFVTKDPDQGLALLNAAADKAYAPAMSDLGMMYIEANIVPRDVEKGLQLLRDSAVFGSSAAQLYLGTQYESGELVPKEPDRARRYFRLCAASGQRTCQFHLAKLMFETPNRKEWEYLQALTWFQLAADRGVTEARRVVEAEMPKLTPEQVDWVRRLKAQLVRRR